MKKAFYYFLNFLQLYLSMDLVMENFNVQISIYVILRNMRSV